MAKAKNQTFIPLLLIFFLFSGCYPFGGSGETASGTRIPDEGLTLKFVESVDRDRDISYEKATAAKVHARFTEFEDVRYYLRPPDSFYFRCGTRQELSWYCEEPEFRFL